MIVQWCRRGVLGLPADEALHILEGGAGLTCRLWGANHPGRLDYDDAVERLTERDLERHVNNFSDPDPRTGRPVREVTPFISLSAGCVDRDVLAKANVVNPALRTALEFATDLGTSDGWVFTCYVLVGINRAVGIPALAEEIRELNHARDFSDYFTQGEIAAKINVPSAQILCAEHWTASGGRLRRTGAYVNGRFVPPAAATNERRSL